MNEKINECLKTLNEVSVEIVSLEQQLSGKKNVYRLQNTRLSALILKYGIEEEPPEEPLEDPIEEEEPQEKEEEVQEDQVDEEQKIPPEDPPKEPEDIKGTDKPTLDKRRERSFCPYCGKCQKKYKKVGDYCERPGCTANVYMYFHEPTWRK